MSGATYRITIDYDAVGPDGHGLSIGPWFATITRLSDDMPMQCVYGPSKSTAENAAREWVANETARREATYTVYVDDFGQDAEAHSVKA